MIHVERCKDNPALMQIDFKADAETIAQEYVALTLKLLDNYPIILDRAQWYLEDINALRRFKDE